MSVYAINHLCRETLRDHAFRAAMLENPQQAIAPLDLTEAERAALLAGEVGTLYAMGANAFLLGNLVVYGMVGLNPDNYRARLRAAAGLA